jgi:hypothetical protein
MPRLGLHLFHPLARPPDGPQGEPVTTYVNGTPMNPSDLTRPKPRPTPTGEHAMGAHHATHGGGLPDRERRRLSHHTTTLTSCLIPSPHNQPPVCGSTPRMSIVLRPRLLGTPPPIRRRLGRFHLRDRKCGVQQFANRPHMLGDPERHGGRRLMPCLRRQGQRERRTGPGRSAKIQFAAQVRLALAVHRLLGVPLGRRSPRSMRSSNAAASARASIVPIRLRGTLADGNQQDLAAAGFIGVLWAGT